MHDDFKSLVQNAEQIHEKFERNFMGICKNKTLPCCDYDLSDLAEDSKSPVYWNSLNKCVQCHNCGTIWVPRLKGLY